MPYYRVQGVIMLESTGEEAEYDYEQFFDSEPSEMDVLNDMIQSGEIQIIPSSVEEVEEED